MLNFFFFNVPNTLIVLRSERLMTSLMRTLKQFSLRRKRLLVTMVINKQTEMAFLVFLVLPIKFYGFQTIRRYITLFEYLVNLNFLAGK